MRDLSEVNLTDTVLATLGEQTEQRTRQVLTALIKHLHAFVTEVDLSHEEWSTAIDFLYRAGKISDSTRNEFILASDVFGITSLVDIVNNRAAAQAGASDASVLGPFYIEDSDYLEIGATLPGAHSSERPVVFSGRVLSSQGKPIAGALLDIWQAAENGLYDAADPGQPIGNLRCRMLTDANGYYRFITVRPAPYTVPEDGPVGDLLNAIGRHPWRPAHIHFKVSADGYQTLVTEIFDQDDSYIDQDAVFGVRNSLLIHFESRDSADEAAEYQLQAPFYRVDYDFRLQAI